MTGTNSFLLSIIEGKLYLFITTGTVTGFLNPFFFFSA